MHVPPGNSGGDWPLSEAHPTRLVASGGDVAFATRGGRMVLEVMKRRGLKKLKKT